MQFYIVWSAKRSTATAANNVLAHTIYNIHSIPSQQKSRAFLEWFCVTEKKN